MSVLNKYQIWCETDLKYEYVWKAEGEDVPTSCPTNTAHTVDSSKTAIADEINVEVHDISGRQRVHQSSKPIGSVIYFTGEGDDATSVGSKKGGQEMIIQHKVSDETPQVLDIWFNAVANRTWLHEGYVQWRNAEFDRISLSVVPKLAITTVGSNTNYANGPASAPYLIIPAAGDGTVDIATGVLEEHDGGLVYMPNEDDGTPPVAFWNADWNAATSKFENISAAPTGNGRYNLFNTQITFHNFVNRFPLLGGGFMKMQTSDISELGHGMIVRLTAETIGADHDWDMSILLMLARATTV